MNANPVPGIISSWITLDSYRRRRSGHLLESGQPSGCGAFDKTVSSGPFTFAEDAVFIYGF